MSKILFLTLKVFSATGGIEKVCRVAGKAMYEMRFTQPVQLQVLSMHDRQKDADDNPYFPTEIFKGFCAHKTAFVKQAVLQAVKADILILSHINLLLVAWLTKKIAPHTKIYLFAHGIEIWGPLKGIQKKMIRSVDQFICVSHFTQSALQKNVPIARGKSQVLHNCLDPFLPVPAEKSQHLRTVYGIDQQEYILFTLTRISSKERYKGYEKVLAAMAQLMDKPYRIKYLIAGEYDATEKKYLLQLMEQYGLQNKVIICGYLPDDALASHFALADLYIMPSRGEGFGIVFNEAMYYGLPVIAGNADGSVDALLNGQLGLLVNPDSVQEIAAAIEKILLQPEAYKPNRELLLQHFGYENYKTQLEQLLQCSNSLTSISSGDMLMASKT